MCILSNNCFFFEEALLHSDLFIYKSYNLAFADIEMKSNRKTEKHVGTRKEKEKKKISSCSKTSLICHVITDYVIILFIFFVLCVAAAVLRYFQINTLDYNKCQGMILTVDNVRCDGQQICKGSVENKEISVSNSSLYNCTQFKNNTLQCTTCQQQNGLPTINPYTLGMWALLGFYFLCSSIFMIFHCVGSLPCLSALKNYFKLFVIAFFYPVPVSTDVKNKWKVELITVKFIAWEYAGCDTLWAGILTCFCDRLESRFGKYRTRYFRRIRKEYQQNVKRLNEYQQKEYQQNVNQQNVNQQNVNQQNVNQQNINQQNVNQQNVNQQNVNSTVQDPNVCSDVEMRPYTCCSVPNFIWAVAVMLFIPLTVIIIALTIDTESIELPKKIIAAVLGGGATLTFLFSVTKLLFSLSKSAKSHIENLQRQMFRPDIKQELGFMHLVKQEVHLLNELIGFMENFEGKNFRFLLLVDDLDRCEKQKVLKMLEAVSILLSEPNTRFISLIAVDPRIVVKSVELSVDVIIHDSRINGHEYLKKIIHLPFWLPEMDDSKVKKLVQSYMLSEESKSSCKSACEKECTCEPGTSSPKNGSRPVDRGGNETTNQDVNPETNAVKEKIQCAFKMALRQIQNCPKHVCHNPRSIKRICNVLNMTMRLYVSKRKSPRPVDIRKLV